MEEKFAMYVDEEGNTNCKITPQENGGVLFEWNDAEGLISHLVIFKDGKLVNSKKGGSLLLDFEDANLVAQKQLKSVMRLEHFQE